VLSQTVELYDVKDAEGFVRATIAKGHLLLTEEQRDELTQEGLRIMWKLSSDYEPGRNGLDASTSKFSGYAAKYLPGKLSDAWHRLQGHRLVTLSDGSRKWKYDPTPVSIDKLTKDSPEGADHIPTLHGVDYYSTDLAGTLGAALDEQWQADRDNTIKVGVLLGMGESVVEVARTLRLGSEEVLGAVERIKRVSHRLGALEAA
jgi:hypothetical protein